MCAFAHLDQVDPAEIKCLSSKAAGVRLLKDFTSGEKFHQRQRTKTRGEETGDGDKAARRRGESKGFQTILTAAGRFGFYGLTSISSIMSLPAEKGKRMTCFKKENNNKSPQMGLQIRS